MTLRLLLVCSISTLLFACASAPTQEAPAPIAEASSPLDGAYEFIHIDTPDGPSTTQRGHLLVSGDYVCHVRVVKERESIGEDDSEEVRLQKSAQLAGSTTAACGTYSIEGDRLTANWVTSHDPANEGNATEFIFTQDGDQVVLAPAAAPQFKFVYKKLN